MIEVDAAEFDDLRRRAAEAVRPLVVERLGVAVDADARTVMAALDRALARTEPEPEPGSVLIDQAALADLERDAAAGRVTRHQRLVADAINRGKITPAARSNWLLLLETDPGAEAALAKIKPNTAVPIAPRGYGYDRDTDPDRDLIDGLWPGEPH